MIDPDIKYLTSSAGVTLAFEQIHGSEPTVVFLGGYHSEMIGTKGSFLAHHCRLHNRAYLRLDYSGHGLSGGQFEDGTIGRWCSDAMEVIDHCVEGPLVLVGSSMGGWIMLLVARALGERVKAMVGIASAPDFTRDLMWNAFDDETRVSLERDGIVYLDSGYEEEKIPVRREFIDDGLRHIQLDTTIPVTCPVHLLQGRKDTDVPWQTAEKISKQLESNDVTISYFKDGDHRLSDPVYLDYLSRVLDALLARV